MAATRKTTRRTIRRRISQYTPGSSVFKLSEEQFRELEGALGQPIPPSVRERLQVEVQECISETFGEKSAPFVDDVDDVVAKVRAAAKALEQALMGSSRDATQRYARLYLSVAYQEQGAGRSSLDPFRSDLSALISASTIVRQKLKEMDGPKEGDAWNSFVRRTTRLFKAHDLPTGAPKDRPLSPYLQFLRALGKMDAAFARYTTTDSALQTAVGRARTKRAGHPPHLEPIAEDPCGAFEGEDDADE
jgi:hypothetical protein